MKLNNNQVKQLSEFCSNLSIIFFASVVTPFFSNIDRIDLVVVGLGLADGFFFFVTSLVLLGGKEKL